jgi:hypothetical protein
LTTGVGGGGRDFSDIAGLVPAHHKEALHDPIALALLAALVVAAPARAGLGDPLPAPFTKHVFSVPGVINNGVVTVVSCTNALLTPLNVGVEWFKKDGTSLGVSSFSIPAGATANFGTDTTIALPMDALMPVSAPMKSGSARILSTTSSGILCTAFVMDKV